jgi:hypothetical protein
MYWASPFPNDQFSQEVSTRSYDEILGRQARYLRQDFGHTLEEFSVFAEASGQSSW